MAWRFAEEGGGTAAGQDKDDGDDDEVLNSFTMHWEKVIHVVSENVFCFLNIYFRAGARRGNRHAVHATITRSP